MHRQQQHTPPLVPMYMSSIRIIFVFRLSDYGVAEITWENGQPAMHGNGRANETLESIVHQATTCYNQSQNQEIDLQERQNRPTTHNISSNVASSGGKWVESAGPSYLEKRTRSSATVYDQYGNQEKEEECRNDVETIRSRSSRASRAAAIHNLSERRRRERINQKMKALQKLVPNANKTDKASMLDEVIEYLKKLQTQVQLMKNMPIRPPQMMIPLPVPLQLQQQRQHQLQMSMLAQMRMGLGLENSMLVRSQHPFMLPEMMASPWLQTIHNQPSTNTADPLSEPQCAFLAQVCQESQNGVIQHMNTDIYNKMDVFYQQQVNQGKSIGMSSSQPDHVQGE